MTASSLLASCSRSLPMVAGLLLATATIPASAQTTIRMTTTQGTSCVAVTDANGLTLAPGSTDLQATGVTLTGTGCGAGSVPAPTSPNGLALTATPAAPTAGVAFSVAWQVSNATSCVGSVTAGTAANVSGWTQVSTPASPRAVTISAPGAYTLVLTCSNAGNPTNLVSPPLQLAVGDGSACTAPGLTRINTSDISYGAFVTPVRTAVDVREWDNIWGHANTTDPLMLWPGISGSGPTLRQFQRTSFLAAHFRTGASGTPSGFFTHPYIGMSLPIDMTISTTCGEFVQAPAGCIATNISTMGQVLVSWTFATNNQTKCILQPNTDYWVNMKYHDPNTSGCPAGTTCPLPTLDQFTQ